MFLGDLGQVTASVTIMFFLSKENSRVSFIGLTYLNMHKALGIIKNRDGLLEKSPNEPENLFGPQ